MNSPIQPGVDAAELAQHPDVAYQVRHKMIEEAA